MSSIRPLFQPLRRSLPLIPSTTTTRTRRLHGALTIGTASATVHSTRRGADTLGVTVTVAAEALQLTGGLTPTQARSMARALIAAADAAERAQGGAR